MGNSEASETQKTPKFIDKDDKQWKNDTFVLNEWQKTEDKLTSKQLDHCYETNSVPEEHERILSVVPKSLYRHLRHSKKYTAEKSNKECIIRNCKYKNIKANKIKLSTLSRSDWIHIATLHHKLYKNLQKRRKGRFTLDGLAFKQRSAPPITINSNHTNTTYPKINNKPKLKKASSVTEGKRCGVDYICAEFQKFCDYYHNIKPANEIIEDYNIINHCILYHVEDYPPKICTCPLWDSDSVEYQHIAHGHWYHRSASKKLETENKQCEERRNSTYLVQYKSLSPSLPSPLSMSSLSKQYIFEGDGDNDKKEDLNIVLENVQSIGSPTNKLQKIKSLKDALSAENISDTFEELQFGSPFFVKKKEAMFRNPKQEMLQNEYRALSKAEWNDLLKKCVCFAKAMDARRNNLSIKEVVGIKIYTDFDELQREYRKCFRSNKKKRQKQFFWWNKLLEIACNKSRDTITKKIYHGVSTDLTLSTFSGTYYGPVSTTTKFDVARGFAGKVGRIIELYPSFGKKGLKVSWLSNFPDEEEILYMNTSFQIYNFYGATALSPKKTMIGGLHDANIDQSFHFERAVMKAIQLINIESKVISLNIHNKYSNYDQDEKDEIKDIDNSGWIDLSTKTQLAVLYLLYLQYRKNEWNDFLKNTNESVKYAFEKFRQEFVSLAENVKAVKMERLSKPIQQFLYTSQRKYEFPIQWYSNNNATKHEKVGKIKFKSQQPLCMDTIIRLFPNAEQIAINGDNWDFSLQHFILFLQKFDMDYANVKLQDIYIKFTMATKNKFSGNKKYNIVTDNERAKQLTNKQSNIRNEINKLRKLGWKFINNSHLHRVSCEPTPELPFVVIFCKPRTNTRYFYQSYSMLFTEEQIQEINTSNSNTPISSPISHDYDEVKTNTNTPTRRRSGYEPGYSNRFSIDSESPTKLMQEKSVEQVNDDMIDGQRYVVVQYNPANCILSDIIFDTLTYKDELIEFLKFRKDNWKLGHKKFIKIDLLKAQFIELCVKVETLVLDPMTNELKEIFMEYPKNQKSRAIISFETIYKIFPNIQELFLRDTILNLRICYKLVEFSKTNSGSKLQRVFFKKPTNDKDIPDRHILRFRLVLNPYSWDVTKYEYFVQKHIMD